jgi:hypothetical protein
VAGVDRDLADLEAVIDALPEYLTRGELYLNLPRPREARLSLPVSIGLAQDRLKRLKGRTDLSLDVQARLAGLEARLNAVERLYPEEYKKKLASEQRSRTNTARWQAEDEAEERDREGR